MADFKLQDYRRAEGAGRKRGHEIVVSNKFGVSGVALALAAGLFFVVLSQIDGRLQVVYFLLLLSLPVYMAIGKLSSIRLSGYFALFAFSLILLFLVCSVGFLYSGEPGYFTGFLVLILKTFLMYSIGYMASSFIKGKKDVLVFSFAFVIGALVYAVWLYLNYFPGFSAWLSNQTYLFPSKNSFGQIAGISAICCLVYCMMTRKSIRVVAVGFCGFFLMVLALLLQCRTSVLAFGVSVVFLLVIFKKKRVLLALFVVVVLAVLLIPSLQDYLMHAFLFDKYQSADLNTMSSGRIGAWLVSIGVIGNHVFLGLGDYYVDCLYLNTFANVGVVGFAAVMVVWLGRVHFNLGKDSRIQVRKRNPIALALACMTVFYFVESILEGQPPFGPGACSALFWVLCGIGDGLKMGAYMKRRSGESV